MKIYKIFWLNLLVVISIRSMEFTQSDSGYIKSLEDGIALALESAKVSKDGFIDKKYSEDIAHALNIIKKKKSELKKFHPATQGIVVATLEYPAHAYDEIEKLISKYAIEKITPPTIIGTNRLMQINFSNPFVKVDVIQQLFNKIPGVRMQRSCAIDIECPNFSGKHMLITFKEKNRTCWSFIFIKNKYNAGQFVEQKQLCEVIYNPFDKRIKEIK